MANTRLPTRIQSFLTRLRSAADIVRGGTQGSPHSLMYAGTTNVASIDYENPLAVPDRLEAAGDALALWRIDGRYRKAVSTMRNNLFRAGYIWEHEDENMASTMAALEIKYNLRGMFYEMLESLWLNGDIFIHVHAALREGQPVLYGFRELPPLRTQRLTNDANEFTGSRVGYRVHDTMHVTDSTPVDLTPGAQTYSVAEVNHVALDRQYGTRYGTPLLSGSHGPLKRLLWAEHNIHVRRNLHGALFLHHQLHGLYEGDQATDEQIEQYKAEVASDPKKPNHGYLDITTRDNVTITPVQGDANLSQTGDIDKHAESFFSSLPVPKAILGYADNLNRDIFQVQSDQYLGWLESTSLWVADNIMVPTMQIALVFAGVNPLEVIPEVGWGSREPFTPRDFSTVATGIMHLRKAETLSREDAVRIVAAELNEDPNEMLERLAAERAENEQKELEKETRLAQQQQQQFDRQQQMRQQERVNNGTSPPGGPQNTNR